MLYDDYVLPPGYPDTREVIVQVSRGAVSAEPSLWIPEAPRPDEDIDVALADPAAMDLLEQHIVGLAGHLLDYDAGSPAGLEAIVGNDDWIRHLRTLSGRFGELEATLGELDDQLLDGDINEGQYLAMSRPITTEFNALKKSVTLEVYQQMEG